MNLHESGENYLETIFLLEKRLGEVRSVDVARELGFSKPSVSRAINLLKDQQLITLDGHNHIHLMPAGREKAVAVYERHYFLTQLFKDIGVPADIAEKDACRIEHILSPETYEGLKNFALRRKQA